MGVFPNEGLVVIMTTAQRGAISPSSKGKDTGFQPEDKSSILFGGVCYWKHKESTNEHCSRTTYGKWCW